MKKALSLAIFILVPCVSQATPMTVYRGVQSYPKPPVHQPDSLERSVQWYKGTPQQPYSNYRRQPPKRSGVLVAPHVDINIYQQPQTSYQRTEEVYLPHGGTYRSVTTTISDDGWYNSPTISIHGHYGR